MLGWVIDQEACTAIHHSGLRFRFTQGDDGKLAGQLVKPYPVSPDWAYDRFAFERFLSQAGEAYTHALSTKH